MQKSCDERDLLVMEPIHSDDMEGFVHDSSKLLNSPYLNGINGDPELLPRIGDQYQADIPVLLTDSDRLKLIRCFHSDPPLHNLLTFGLPIPLMWTRSEKFRGFREADIEKATPPIDQSLQKAASMKPRSIVLALPCQKNAKFKFDWLDKSLYPFPGTLGQSWEDAEQERFLLGLYCLGKNLVLVQRFVGTKHMGDMLSYYYGSFYRSNEYRRWVDGRKSRTRRSVQGQKLLSGWRQQELLSRISSHVSEECKSTLLKVSKAFREDKIALEDYVFALKNTVGIDMLTQVIGIGKGERDLTNCALEPTKLNHGASGNSEVRIRNDLPIADIVKFLTGEYRMSKTRSSDLFWEAVWPRLLARGWHSEQPKDGPKNSLVFLVPEANKFSRRKMSKGKHYFDSLTDVLNKVALDPSLLELDEDLENKGSKEEVIKNDPPINLEEFDDSSPNSKKKKKYLQPRSKTRKIQEVMMFTIIDTSETNGVEGCTLKELRSLPVGTGSSQVHSPSYLSESEDNLSEESENKAETTAKSMASRVCGGGSINSGKSSSVNMDNATSRSTNSLNERQQRNRKGGRPRNPKLLPVCTKRSSLADCTLREAGCFGETQSRKKKPVKKGKHMRPNPLEADLNVVLMREEHIDQDQTLKLSSTSSFAIDSSCRRNEDREISPERSETREDFDLNVSQISLEREADNTDTVIVDIVQNSESSCAEQSSVQVDVEMQCKPQELQVTADLLPGRRQSTRTRPLTTKALEAFAFGYLGNSNKKRKASEESRTKSTKRIHRHSLVSSKFRNGTVEDGSNTDENE
ncbi:Homeobox-like domain superfamily [Arabidopsis thaliana x Arabidopsis arenosa]|uniref:Homeobox-like domain superfamily n=1 Tax=Arabidopsis thaliana x Arabidopsis arenosa TaxID=1240361 RepID=A0A8T2ADK3_9BRAS|nr:Homeobox-like domain superfamily [Arabidopsis thaliana x Arabidopsis arenosa]